jgi:hypothetical protein
MILEIDIFKYPLMLFYRYDSRCFPLPRRLLPVLITGLGGAGTRAIATRLQEAGVRVEHEGIGADGSVVRYILFLFPLSML